LIRWLDLMRSWGTASRLCVSHSESIAELGMSGVKNVRKIIRRVKLDVLIDDVAQQILMLHILCPSLLIPLYPSLRLSLPRISHLPSQSPILHPLGPSNEFRKMSHHSHIKLPTRASRDSISWGLGIYHKISADSHWKFDSCVVHTASDPVVDVIPIFYPDKACSPPNFHDVFSHMIWSLRS